MKRAALIANSAGLAVLVVIGLDISSLVLSVPAEASTSDGVTTAQTTAAQTAAVSAQASGNVENIADRSMCIDANANDYPNNGDNIQLWTCNTHPEQEWTITSAGQLKNTSTSMCIDANANDYPNNGDNIQLWTCNTHPEQEWMLGPGESTSADNAAANWARSQVGSSEDSGLCLTFVIDAWLDGAGINLRSGYVNYNIGSSTY